VIKVILQFCRENNLSQSFQAISAECQARTRGAAAQKLSFARSRCLSASAPLLCPQVSLNTVDNLDAFTADVNAGRWDIVLPQARALRSWMQ
jgi:WD40 repeat-containing protein SMU1